MKKRFLLLIFIISSLSYGQFANRIKFTYDDAGNQIRRYICLCTAKSINDTVFKDSKTVTSQDMIKDEIDDFFSYYPNPVKEELYIKWETKKENYISFIDVYSINGQLLNKYENLRNLNFSTISFQSYQEGVYEILLVYSDGKKKSFKIVKK